MRVCACITIFAYIQMRICRFVRSTKTLRGKHHYRGLDVLFCCLLSSGLEGSFAWCCPLVTSVRYRTYEKHVCVLYRCIRRCTHTYMGTYIHAACRHSFIHSFIHTYVHTCRQTDRHLCMCIHIYTHTGVPVYVCKKDIHIYV